MNRLLLLLLLATAPLATAQLTSSAPNPVTGDFTVHLSFADFGAGVLQSSVSAANLQVVNGTLIGASHTGVFAAFGFTWVGGLSATIRPTHDGPVTVYAVGVVTVYNPITFTVNAALSCPPLVRTADIDLPVATLAASPGPFKAPFEVAVAFNKPVTGLSPADFAISPPLGVVPTLSGSGSSYLLTCSPQVNGTVSILLPAGTVTDLQGRTNPADSNRIDRLYDDRLPEPAVSAPTGTATGAFTVTITWDDTVTALPAAGIAATNATVTISDTHPDHLVMQLTLRPIGDGPVQASLLGGAVQDKAGNPNVPTTLCDLMADVIPRPVFSVPAGSASQPFVVGLTFTRPVQGLDLADLALTGTGRILGLSGAEAAYAVTLAPEADGDLALVLAAGAVTDADGEGYGNPGASSASRACDITAPQVTLGLPPAPVTGDFTVALTWSEPLAGLDPGALVFGNVLQTGVIGDSSLQVRPGSDGLVSITLPAGAARDLAGNPSAPASASLEAQVQPRLALASATSAWSSQPFAVTLTSSTPLASLDGNLITCTGPANHGGVSGAGQTWTLTVTPIGDGPITLAIQAGAGRDPFGRSSLDLNASLGEADLTPPSLVSWSATAPQALSATFAARAVFSEPIPNLDASDLSLVDCQASAFQTADGGLTWTLEIAIEDEDHPGTATLIDACDRAGNHLLSPGGAVSFRRDTGPPIPTLAFTPSATAGLLAVVGTFNEDVLASDLHQPGRLQLANGSLVGCIWLAPTIPRSGYASGCRLEILPLRNAPGRLEVQLLAGATADLNGNPSLASNRLEIPLVEGTTGQPGLPAPYLVGSSALPGGTGGCGSGTSAVLLCGLALVALALRNRKDPFIRNCAHR